MKYFIQKALTDWAYKVNDGCPDPQNRTHIQILEAVLRQHGCTEEFISEYLPRVQKLHEDDIVKNKETGNVYTVKNHNPETQSLVKKDASPEDIKKVKQAPDSDDKVIISGKDKTLKKGNPSESDEFKKDLEPDDDTFNEKNKQYAIPTPPEPYKLPEGITDNPKFPKRYAKALERMMNTTVTDDTKSWSHFSDIEGGAGQISAQAGELMTMVGTSMSDDDFNNLMDSLEAHEKEQVSNNPELKKEGTRVVTKSWIKSARNTRKAILDRVKIQYGEGAEVIGTSWDAKDEVEAMGLTDYEKNKGFSTDMYVKIKTADGKELLDEVSLKKDKNVNFLNSGSKTMVEDWDPEKTISRGIVSIAYFASIF